jgi:hypothetical protein
LRSILSERGTWQLHVDTYILNILSIFEVKDSMRVSNVQDLLENSLFQLHRKKLYACSLDVKDLFYNIPVEWIESAVEKQMNVIGPIVFANKAGIQYHSFIQILKLFLRSTVVELSRAWGLRQLHGICIGLRIASLIASICMAEMNERIAARIAYEVSQQLVSRNFVDDYLLLAADPNHLDQAQKIFSQEGRYLQFTREDQIDGNIQFLQVNLRLVERLCWMYMPRSGKQLLPNSSFHSSSIKEL